jgi:hypothetical protein
MTRKFIAQRGPHHQGSIGLEWVFFHLVVSRFSFSIFFGQH